MIVRETISAVTDNLGRVEIPVPSYKPCLTVSVKSGLYSVVVRQRNSTTCLAYIVDPMSNWDAVKNTPVEIIYFYLKMPG